MKKFIIVRLLKSLLVIWFIVTIVFVFTRLSGDPTDWILPDDVTETVRQRTRESLGLDRPIYEQYVKTVTGLFSGDMGRSYYYLRPVGDLFAERVGATLRLGLTALALAILLGIPLGVFAAVKRNSIFDRVTMGISIAGHTIPNFVFGILLIFLFALQLRLLPSGGTGTIRHYIMPAMALSVSLLANVARLTRSSMLDVLRQDYLDCARSKGLREGTVIFKHALRNALIPVVTIVGLQLGHMIGGTIVVETVFAWPGIGSLIIPAAQNRDFPVIQFGVMIIAVAVTLANLLVDLSYAFLDPKIRDNF